MILVNLRELCRAWCSLAHLPSTPAPLPLVCRAALALVFYCLAVTVEDLMHDSSVIELLWTSCGDPELVEVIEEEEVAMKVRTWIGELLSRSLLLGNAAGIHLHGACVNE